MSTLGQQQRALGAYLRDPDAAAAPAGIDPSALAVYRRLYRANIAQLLAANFPLIHATVDRDSWADLVAGFCRDRSVATPLFPRIGGEFVRHLQARELPARWPWLAELALHEWTETELRADASPAPPHDPAGDIVLGVPVPSPWIRLHSHAWPVHRIGPDNAQPPRPATPTWLLARRDGDGRVVFAELSPWTARLVAMLIEGNGQTGGSLAARLAAEAGCPGDAGFLADALALLRRMHVQGSLLGTRSG